MDNTDLFRLTANDAHNQIITKTIKIRDYLDSIINRIKTIEPVVHCWTSFNFEKSLEIASKLDEKLSEVINPLYGIPIGVKDIFNTIDFPTEMGSQFWKDFTPGNDARVVYNLKMNDAIILGKTETAEFAVHALGNSLNPYDPNRTPGTSSSGSAIAVATQMIPLALGTQTAGSIIRPASYCGVYGFKPSFGTLPRTGMLKTTDSLDQIGFFARTPHDLEILFNSTRVKGRNYPLIQKFLENEKLQKVQNRKWKIKFVKSDTWEKAEPYTKNLISKFIDKLVEIQEYDVSYLDLPDDFSFVHQIHEKIYAKSLAYYFKKELEEKTLVSEIFYDLATKSKVISLKDFDDAIKFQNKLSSLLDDAFDDFDIIISLSTAGHAPLRNELEKDDPSLIWTMCGVPSMNLPIFKTDNNLPLGIQIISRKYNDYLLLNFAKELFDKKLIPEGPFPSLNF